MNKKLFLVALFAIFLLVVVPVGFAQNDTDLADTDATDDTDVVDDDTDETDKLEETNEAETDDKDEVEDEKCATPGDLEKDEVHARYGFSEYRIDRHLVGMDAVISYAEELNDNTADLESLKIDFKAKKTDLAAAENKEDFKAIVDEMKDIAKEFKETARQLIGGDNLEEARERVESEIDLNDEELKSELDEAHETGQKHQLAFFDLHVCKSQNFLNKMSRRGVDVAAAQEELDLVKERKNELENALIAAHESCKETPLFECNTDEKKALDDLKTDLREDFKAVKDKVKDAIVDTKAKADEAKRAKKAREDAAKEAEKDETDRARDEARDTAKARRVAAIESEEVDAIEADVVDTDEEETDVVESEKIEEQVMLMDGDSVELFDKKIKVNSISGDGEIEIRVGDVTETFFGSEKKDVNGLELDIKAWFHPDQGNTDSNTGSIDLRVKRSE